MSEFTPPVPHEPTRIPVEHYDRLVEAGVLSQEDRVELLEGVIVAVAPTSPRHATVVELCAQALRNAVGARACVRTQNALVLGRWSSPEPDVAVVPGSHRDYLRAHPDRALLVVEVADTSLPQDRLSKSRIYAAAAIPEFWIVNLREECLEVMRQPDPVTGLYREIRRCAADESVAASELPGAIVDIRELLPQSS
jgi:Uma2 family endonuclease